MLLLVFSLPCAQGDVGAADGESGTVLAPYIKGVEVKVLIQLRTPLERVIVWPSSGLAVARGAGFKSLSPFHSPCSVFPGDADGAGKYM